MTDELNLRSPDVRRALAAEILYAIDGHCIKSMTDPEPRKHLGASELGAECSRQLWYSFRWFMRPQFSGRQLRLFDRGKREEVRFVEWLRGIGFTVWTHQDNEKQFHITYAPCGHIGGSLDGVANIPNYEPMLLEFKTKGTGSEFNKLKEKGVALVMPKHFKQMSIYGKSYDLKYALYFCINKNDDDLYVEVVELDWELAADLLKRGEDIVNSPVAPHRISDNPAYLECKLCDYNKVCFQSRKPDVNCRTCKHSRPMPTGEWVCKLGGGAAEPVIPDNVIKVGCIHYVSL